MRLIELTANKDSFRTVKFNQTGLSLIIGKQKEPKKTDAGKTYNGVGKSLLVTLIHFCLGSDPNENLKSGIPNWEFSLIFELNGKKNVSMRSTSSQDKIYLNNEEMGLKEFRSTLESNIFYIPSGISYLKFRPLISRFIRKGKGSYVSFDNFIQKEQPYSRLLCNAFLLGIDIDLIVEKKTLKDKLDNISRSRKNLKKDPILRKFFTESRNVEINLKDIEEEIHKIEEKLIKYKVADNYYEIQQEADKLKKELDEKKNSAVLLNNGIDNINKSIIVRPDISIEKLLRVYKEAKTVLPERVVKDIQEVKEFHYRLSENREKRLNEEKIKLAGDLKLIGLEIAELSNKLDSYMEFLGTHGALDEFVKISNYLNELKAKSKNLQDFRILNEKYVNEIQEIRIALSGETKKAIQYLSESKDEIDEHLDRFRSFSKKIYPDRPSGLTLRNNDGENQSRFDLDATIEGDASDGINEVKIFCFDMTILTGRYNHDVDFIFHDSRLFSDIDPRQRATLFKIAYDECTSQSGLQYIATMNEDQVAAMKGHLENEEYDRIFNQTVILELTDESPESRLLGIKVDMQHEM